MIHPDIARHIDVQINNIFQYTFLLTSLGFASFRVVLDVATGTRAKRTTTIERSSKKQPLSHHEILSKSVVSSGTGVTNTGRLGTKPRTSANNMIDNLDDTRSPRSTLEPAKPRAHMREIPKYIIFVHPYQLLFFSRLDLPSGMGKMVENLSGSGWIAADDWMFRSACSISR